MRLSSHRTLTVLVMGLVMVAAGVIGLSGAATAQAALQDLKFEGAWARAASEGHMSAVYMTVTNTSGTTVDIVSVHADVAEKSEVHETTTEITFVDGKISQVMRMEAIDVLTIAPAATVELKPGGLHVMLIGLTTDLEEGDTFKLTLQSGTGETVVIDVPVTVGIGGDDHDDHEHHAAYGLSA